MITLFFLILCPHSTRLCLCVCVWACARACACTTRRNLCTCGWVLITVCQTGSTSKPTHTHHDRKVIKDSDFHGFAPQVGNQLRQKIQRWNIQKRKNIETLLLNKTALTVYPKNCHDWWMETQREERNEGAVTPGDQQAFGFKGLRFASFLSVVTTRKLLLHISSALQKDSHTQGSDGWMVPVEFSATFVWRRLSTSRYCWQRCAIFQERIIFCCCSKPWWLNTLELFTHSFVIW